MHSYSCMMGLSLLKPRQGILASILLTTLVPVLSLANPLTCQSILPGGPQTFLGRAALALKSQLYEPPESEILPAFIKGEEFQEIEALSEDILQRYPPSDYVFVGVGRSPTPVMAYLQARGGVEAYNLPISSFRNHPEARSVFNQTDGFERALSRKFEDKLQQHFLRFLPEPSSLAGRKIVLLDYLQTGRSLVATRAYLQRFFQNQNANVEVIPFGISDPDHAHTTDFTGGDFVDLKEGRLLQHLRGQFYDFFSQYGSYELPKGDSEQIKANPKYLDLVNEWRGRIKAERRRAS